MRTALRRGVWAACTFSLLFAFAARRAQATLGERVLRETRGAFAFLAAARRGPARLISINGAAVRIDSGYSSESLAGVLDRAQASCRRDSAGLSRRARLAERLARLAVGSVADGVLRAQTDDEGLVACLGLGEDERSLAQLAARVERFTVHGDLQELGGVRVLRAQRRGGHTFFVEVSSFGSVPIFTMFPARGDAPGADPSGLPRPARARRVLSLRQAHRESGLYVYDAAPGERTFQAHVSALRAAGWVSYGPAVRSARGGQSQLWSRAGQTVLVYFEPRDDAARIVMMPLSGEPSTRQVTHAVP